MNRTKRKNFLYAAVSFSVCLLIYLAVGFAVIYTPSQETEGNAGRVEDTRGEDFTVLLCCDELSHYAALYAEPGENRLTLMLFDSKQTAENFGFKYDRRVNYTKLSEIDLIGRIGGIVIEEEICYNNSYQQRSSGRRVLGAAAVDLSCGSDEMREVVAHEILFSFLECNLSSDDFSYLISQNDTDISYADCYRNYGVLQQLKYNITVQTVKGDVSE